MVRKTGWNSTLRYRAFQALGFHGRLLRPLELASRLSWSLAHHNKKGPNGPSLLWCARLDSNQHEIAPASPSS